MPNLYVDVANCPISGEKTTLDPEGGWKRNRIDLSLSRYAVSICQTDHGMPTKHQAAKGRTVHTTTIKFGDIQPHRRKLAESIADDITWLLSFATMSPVRPFMYRYGKDTKGYAITQKAVIFRPTIETQSGAAVRDFLLLTWPHFRRLKRTRKLKSVIDYLTIAEHPDQPVEVSTLLCFTALESLKSSHSPGAGASFRSGWMQCSQRSECTEVYVS